LVREKTTLRAAGPESFLYCPRLWRSVVVVVVVVVVAAAAVVAVICPNPQKNLQVHTILHPFVVRKSEVHSSALTLVVPAILLVSAAMLCVYRQMTEALGDDGFGVQQLFCGGMFFVF